MTPVNSEINKKFREIRRKCNNKKPEHYPAYCHRAVLDILNLLNLMRQETISIQSQIDNLTFLDNFVKVKEIVR